ncbi:MAG TPA: EAL domain-containing protein [Thermoleophilaceae bacterium]
MRTSGQSLRSQVLIPLAVAIALVALCVGLACTLSARNAAKDGVAARAEAARATFEQAARPSRRLPGPASVRRALAEAAASGAGVAFGEKGANATLAPQQGGHETFTYRLTNPPGTLTVSVPSDAIGKATTSALVKTLGIGLGAFLVFFPLIASLLDRRLAAPLRSLADAVAKGLAGDTEARAAVEGPAEIVAVTGRVNDLLQAQVESTANAEKAENTDYLTGAASNRQFQETLGIEIKRAQREQNSVGLVVLGLDRFESINDNYGHAKGDEVLRNVAEELRDMLRATDVLSRLGGDEFALILPGTDPDVAYSIAERARSVIAELSPNGRRLTSSAGVACYPDHARDESTLLQFANGALRLAKREGKNQSRRYDPEVVVVPRGEDELAEVEALFELEEPIVPFFQPLVALSTGKILGFEALARFPHPPQRGPDAWFAQAHRCNLGAKLEAMAIEAALEHQNRPAGTFLSINVSPTIIATPEIQEVLPEDMSNLVVEITEHELADDIDTVLAELQKLRDRGARIAVDDAGSGYSGLQQVMLVHPDVIKLDRSLVMGLNDDPAKVALIDSFVRFARRTGATVCAEGIETMEELRTLADLDVTYGQGYALARPADDWTSVSSAVSEALLRRSLQSQADVTADSDPTDSGDKRLEFVSARISQVGSLDELGELLELIAAEVGSDDVTVSRWLPEDDSVETICGGDQAPAGERFKLSNYPSTRHVLTTQEAVQVLVSDPGADLGEVALLQRTGFAALLMVPVVCRGETLGLIEALSRTERPWTRSEINRARIISYQLGSAIDGIARESGAEQAAAATA